ncbi:MAG: hypothetical protein PHC70_03770 [Patescibacteria group bacterium]|nr:hypothetical protein [Patescibacteria group bacterium]
MSFDDVTAVPNSDESTQVETPVQEGTPSTPAEESSTASEPTEEGAAQA